MPSVIQLRILGVNRFISLIINLIANFKGLFARNEEYVVHYHIFSILYTAFCQNSQIVKRLGNIIRLFITLSLNPYKSNFPFCFFLSNIQRCLNTPANKTQQYRI